MSCSNPRIDCGPLDPIQGSMLHTNSVVDEFNLHRTTLIARSIFTRTPSLWEFSKRLPVFFINKPAVYLRENIITSKP
jgi:hypothetical protein